MASEARRGGVAVAAALAAAWAIFFAPALLGDGQFLYRDAGRMHHPVKRWIAEELRRGHLPEWNPYAGMGVPVVAGGVDAPLHPLNALFLVAPFEAAFKAWVLLSVLGAGLGAAAWARQLGRTPAGAAAAGLAFMLSGFVVSSTDNLTYLTTLAAAPWLLAAAHAAASAGGPGWLLAVTGASFLTAAGGDPMGWALAVALASAQALLIVEGPPARRGVRAALVVLVAVLGAAPVVLPILAWIPHSSRAAAFAAGEYARWNLHPLRLLELVVPDLFRSSTPGNLYAGVFHAYAGNAYTTIPWVVSIYAGAAAVSLAAFGALRDRGARRLALLALVIAWMALGPNAGFGQLARSLPILSSFRFWEKLVAWVTLLPAAAAGAGVDRLLANPREGRRLAIAVGASGALLGGAWAAAALAPGALARWVQLGDRTRLAEALVANVREGAGAAAISLGLLAAVALLIARGRLARLGAAALVAVLALDLGAANVRAYVLAPPGIVSEPSPIAERLRAEPGLPRVVTPFRIAPERWPELRQFEAGWRWLARTAGAASNVALRIGNLDAYTGMLPARLIRFRSRTDPTTVAAPAALWGFGAVVVPGSAALATQAGIPAGGEATLADPALPAYVVRQPARPRIALAGPLDGADEAGALEFVLAPGASASGRSVVEGPVPAGYRPPVGEARLVADEGERLVVTARADAPALLVVNDANTDGWSATVDGLSSGIVAVNYLARGIWVPAGDHTVELRYRTPWLRAGAALAAAATLVLSALALRRGWRRRASSAGPEAPAP
ncbi:YfhO family protein [Anaeromyxobacter oryzae]|uniref:YfhO family protein n=1 Tax=Anaeromyxobacter oryzae TaxID=2918170 RepID=A0ABN6MTJ9_9BACT|nr:YfhO family protein [Anaeromyxobacter oryzae]BDG04292.1 hypothetical protein AMOR_32880 [Anaeromyxobacter oryzae]